MTDSCIGGDPGPATGLCLLDYENGRLIGRMLLQAVAADAPLVLRELLIARQHMPPGKRVASLEKFVDGRSAGSTGKPAAVTRQLVMELAEVCQMFGYRTEIRPAADVKPWASDRRLKAAGVVTGAMHGDMNHAYDAARHCLYGARAAGVITDPMRTRTKMQGLHPGQVVYDEAPASDPLAPLPGVLDWMKKNGL